MAGTPTGNILNAIQAGRVVLGGGEFDTIPVGQQTVPMKVTGFVPEPAIDIEKTCPAEAAFGDDITFTITVTNQGDEDLDTSWSRTRSTGDIRPRLEPVRGHPGARSIGHTATIYYSPGRTMIRSPTR